MATPDPLENTNETVPSGTISRKQLVIAGILTTVYGLEEIAEQSKHVASLWLLHPRLSRQSKMAPLAQEIITHWNKRLRSRGTRASTLSLIAVSFDQRNHGSRELDPMANEAWKSGNPRHAQDMFSIYRASHSCDYTVAPSKLTNLRGYCRRHFPTHHLSRSLHFS